MRIFHLKIFSSVVLVLMLGVFFFERTVFSTEVVERILAIVNDEVITDQDLELLMAPVAAQYRTTYTGKEFDEKMKEAEQEFLNKAIEDKLILSEAKRRQIVLKDVEVDEIMSEVRNKFPNREVFLNSLTDQGLTEKKLWNRFRDQLMMQKLVDYEVRSKVSVSPGEVSEYYKTHSEEFVQGDRVRLQQILIRIGDRSEEEAKAFAQSLVERLQGGASFEELARTYSQGVEGKDGGEMGWMEKGQLMGEIDEKVFALEKNRITEPIRSSLGYHIFKVVDNQKFSTKPFAEVKDIVQDNLFKEKLRKRIDGWIKNLKKNAYISIR